MLHECALAYVYMAGSPEFPGELVNAGSTQSESPMRPDLETSKFKLLYEALDGKIKKATLAEANRQQTATDMTVNTTNHIGTVFRKDWKDMAVPDGLVSLAIPWNLLEETSSYYRLRMMTAQ